MIGTTSLSLRGFATLFSCVALLAAVPAAAYDVVELEEHWALHVGGPDANRSAPQVSMVMSATGDIESDYFVVTLNHWSWPEFEPGGVQVQRWCGEDCVTATSGDTHLPLQDDGETVRWVQRLKLEGDSLHFLVDNGDSTSWGSFGGDNLKLTSSTNLERLNGYKPAVSINESGIAYAGNRVSSLTLERIRWWDSDGNEHEMVAPIDIDSDLDP